MISFSKYASNVSSFLFRVGSGFTRRDCVIFWGGAANVDGATRAYACRAAFSVNEQAAMFYTIVGCT